MGWGIFMGRNTTQLSFLAEHIIRVLVLRATLMSSQHVKEREPAVTEYRTDHICAFISWVNRRNMAVGIAKPSGYHVLTKMSNCKGQTPIYQYIFLLV